MSTCSFCDSDGELCDLCGGGIGDERVICDTTDDCYMEFCTDTCKTDHIGEAHDGID